MIAGTQQAGTCTYAEDPCNIKPCLSQLIVIIKVASLGGGERQLLREFLVWMVTGSLGSVFKWLSVNTLCRMRTSPAHLLASKTQDVTLLEKAGWHGWHASISILSWNGTSPKAESNSDSECIALPAWISLTGKMSTEDHLHLLPHLWGEAMPWRPSSQASATYQKPRWGFAHPSGSVYTANPLYFVFLLQLFLWVVPATDGLFMPLKVAQCCDIW